MLSFKMEITGIKEATRFLNDFQKKQIPFAVATALNETANQARDEIVKHLQGTFTLRTMWYKPKTRYGINVEGAKKTNLTATIFTRAPWMVQHEEGGTKIPIRGRNLAIPSPFVKRTKRELIGKANRPRNLKNAFIVRSKSGQETIMQRVGRGRNRVLRPMYFLEKSAQIKPAFQFAQIAQRVANERWAKNFAKALDFALRTAK
jgi:hypothetical protein